MATINLIKELAAVNALIDHGVRTGQDRGDWMVNLLSERAELEAALGL
jgi:hypothetical protein